jgi:hypothetical protein
MKLEDGNGNINSLSSMNSMNPKSTNSKNDKFLIWRQNIEGKREDLIDMCFHHGDHVKRIVDVLNEEEKNNGLASNYQSSYTKANEKKSKGNHNILPNKVQNNINETRRLNNDLKKKVEEISKMNAMYVVKHGEKYFNNNVQDNNNNNKDNELPKILSRNNTATTNNNNLYETSKGPTNFRYINDNYRTQLMRAFLNFNPIIHLNNLRNLLEKADPEIQQ